MLKSTLNPFSLVALLKLPCYEISKDFYRSHGFIALWLFSRGPLPGPPSLQGPPLESTGAAGASARAGASLRKAGLGLAGLGFGSALVWLWFGWLLLGFCFDFGYRLDFGFGLIWLDSGLARFGFGLLLVGFGLVSVGFRLELAWISNFRLLLQGFLFILASYRLSELTRTS